MLHPSQLLSLYQELKIFVLFLPLLDKSAVHQDKFHVYFVRVRAQKDLRVFFFAHMASVRESISRPYHPPLLSLCGGRIHRLNQLGILKVQPKVSTYQRFKPVPVLSTNAREGVTLVMRMLTISVQIIYS